MKIIKIELSHGAQHSNIPRNAVVKSHSSGSVEKEQCYRIGLVSDGPEYDEENFCCVGLSIVTQDDISPID